MMPGGYGGYMPPAAPPVINQTIIQNVSTTNTTNTSTVMGGQTQEQILENERQRLE